MTVSRAWTLFFNSPCFFLEIAYSVQAYRRITICFILCQPLTLNYPPCCFLPWNPNIYSSGSVSFFTEHTEGRKGVLHLKNVPSIFANQDYYLEIFVCFFREYIPSISGCHASRFRQNEQILFLFSLRARGKGPFVLGNTHLLGGQASQKKTAFLSLCLYRKRGKDECKALRSFEKGHKMSLFLHTWTIYTLTQLFTFADLDLREYCCKSKQKMNIQSR